MLLRHTGLKPMQHNPILIASPLAKQGAKVQGARRLLVVMIPAHNEVDNIEEVVEGVAALREQLTESGFTLKIIVVDDGSADETGLAAQSAGADRIVTHKKNRGLGAAVRSGLSVAHEECADIVVKIDADLQHSSVDILSVIQPIAAGDADLVYGERFSKIAYQMPIIRKLGNIAFRGLMRWLTKWPIKDSQPGIFAASKEYLEIFDIPGDYNYTQQLLVDAYLKGMRFSQVPVEFRQRRAGRSFVSLIYPLKVLPQIILVIAMSKPMKIFGTCGALSVLVGTTVFAIQFAQWLFGISHKPVVNVNLVLGTVLFGVQMLFFGILAKLVVLTRLPRIRTAVAQ